MKRALAIAAITVGLFGGGMVAAAPSQAAVVKVGPWDQCRVGERYCGGYMWVLIPMSKIPEQERRSSLSLSLRNSKGKKVKLVSMDSSLMSMPDWSWYNRYQGWYYWADIGNYSIFSKGSSGGQGPIFALPTSLKAGKYTLAYKIKASGYWDCSVTYHDLCRWRRPYTYSKKANVRLAPRQPLEWLTP